MDSRERTLRDMVRDFPESPLPHFSLGNYLLEVGRFPEAVDALEAALRLDPQYAAALLSLGDARAALDDADGAREAYERCAAAGMAQGHPELADDARNRIEEL